MLPPRFTDLGFGIYCVDAELHRLNMVSCYIIKERNAAAIIDTGTYHSIPNIIATLAAANLVMHEVKYIIPTHVHLDHAGAAGELMRLCPNATLITHARGVPHMIDPSRLQAGATAVYGAEAFAKDYSHLVPIPAQRVRAVKDGEYLIFEGRGLRMFETPGHANHHIAIFDSQSRTCFTGDTFGISYREFDTANGSWLFAPTTPVGFDPDAWLNTVDKLCALNPKAVQLTHYGRLGDVLALADQLRASIQTQAELALTEANQPEGRQARLRTKIEQLFLSQIRAHGCECSEAEFKRLMEIDIELNAQGLDIWLQRQTK